MSAKTYQIQTQKPNSKEWYKPYGLYTYGSLELAKKALEGHRKLKGAENNEYRIVIKSIKYLYID